MNEAPMESAGFVLSNDTVFALWVPIIIELK
jgi:hypothetical protein